MLLHVSQQSQLPLCYESFPQCLSATVGGDNARRQGNSLVPSPIRRPKEVSEKRSPTGNYLPFSRTGMSPSTLEGPDKGRERRLAAKVRAAATEGGSARCPLCRGSGMGLASDKQSDKLSGLGSSAGPQGQARQADSGARAQVLDMSGHWRPAAPGFAVVVPARTRACRTVLQAKQVHAGQGRAPGLQTRCGRWFQMAVVDKFRARRVRNARWRSRRRTRSKVRSGLARIVTSSKYARTRSPRSGRTSSCKSRNAARKPKLNNAGLKGSPCSTPSPFCKWRGACACLVASSRWTCDPATNARTAGAPTPREDQFA